MSVLHYGSYRKKNAALEAQAHRHMDLAKKAAVPAGWK